MAKSRIELSKSFAIRSKGSMWSPSQSTRRLSSMIRTMGSRAGIFGHTSGEQTRLGWPVLLFALVWSGAQPTQADGLVSPACLMGRNSSFTGCMKHGLMLSRGRSWGQVSPSAETVRRRAASNSGIPVAASDSARIAVAEVQAPVVAQAPAVDMPSTVRAGSHPSVRDGSNARPAPVARTKDRDANPPSAKQKIDLSPFASGGIRIPVGVEASAGWLARLGAAMTYDPGADAPIQYVALVSAQGTGNSSDRSVSADGLASPIDVRQTMLQVGGLAAAGVRIPLSDKHAAQVTFGGGTLWISETQTVTSTDYSTTSMRPMFEGAVGYRLSIGPGALSADVLYDLVPSDSPLSGDANLGGLAILMGYAVRL